MLLIASSILVLDWHELNGRMDGLQNEFLHVGNALDFWLAWENRDAYHLKHFLETYPWPPGFYVWPWPLFALIGGSHKAMVLANLAHLALLLWATYQLSRAVLDRRAGMLAMVLVALYPSVTGNLVRYEPNLAAVAWVTLSALCLVRSRKFGDRRWSIGLGVALGLGLLMDRLTVGLFLLLPVLVEWGLGLRSAQRQQRMKNSLFALGVVLLIAGPWYQGFFVHHLPELMEQVALGEVDSTGALTERREPFAIRTLLFYFSTLLDAQAGLVPGVAGLLAVGAWLLRKSSKDRVPGVLVLAAWLVFTVVQKKQVYYTIPLLGCLSVLTVVWLRRLPKAGWGVTLLVLVCGVHQVSLRMWGQGLPLPDRVSQWIGGEVLNESWVSPRYAQASQPGGHRWPVEALSEVLPPGDVLVFSEDGDWYEGYLVLQVREQLPGRRVRGLIGDPNGTYEWYRTAASLVYVGADPDQAWPSESQILATLEQQHYVLEDLPPVAEVIASLEPQFVELGAWPLNGGRHARVFSRLTPRVGEPASGWPSPEALGAP
ncbi:MAG: glycosyltransferase family 39 protein [Myxococcota bacterium]|nr:glycosyltransferase family 39 protein [Myxococcota bacterium]